MLMTLFSKDRPGLEPNVNIFVKNKTLSTRTFVPGVPLFEPSNNDCVA